MAWAVFLVHVRLVWGLLGMVAADPALPSPAPQPAGLTIPRLGLQAEVRTTSTLIEGDPLTGGAYRTWLVPLNVIGHHSGTPGFGQPGNVILAGHSVWYGAPGLFYDLPHLEPGDLIYGHNHDGNRATYRVTRRWRSPYDEADWLAESPPVPTLTLYTCQHDLSGLVIVQAELVVAEDRHE